jgi:16S rRNA (guanine966-N2)-methyltransferase
VLDLFAGSGSLGIESLSRGCNLAYFVDRSYRSISLIEYNIKGLKISGEKYKIIKSDVFKFLKFYRELKWDILFIDPPYKIKSDIMIEIFDAISEKKITGSDTLIIYECFFKRVVEEEIKKLNLIKESRLGDKKVLYLSPY